MLRIMTKKFFWKGRFALDSSGIMIIISCYFFQSYITEPKLQLSHSLHYNQVLVVGGLLSQRRAIAALIVLLITPPLSSPLLQHTHLVKSVRAESVDERSFSHRSISEGDQSESVGWGHLTSVHGGWHPASHHNKPGVSGDCGDCGDCGHMLTCYLCPGLLTTGDDLFSSQLWSLLWLVESLITWWPSSQSGLGQHKHPVYLKRSLFDDLNISLNYKMNADKTVLWVSMSGQS